jgi:hypothetical protein
VGIQSCSRRAQMNRRALPRAVCGVLFAPTTNPPRSSPRSPKPLPSPSTGLRGWLGDPWLAPAVALPWTCGASISHLPLLAAPPKPPYGNQEAAAETVTDATRSASEAATSVASSAAAALGHLPDPHPIRPPEERTRSYARFPEVGTLPPRMSSRARVWGERVEAV